MSEDDKTTEPRLEGMLRQWGNDEAAAQAPVGKSPHQTAARPAAGRGGRFGAFAWGLAAGLILAAGAGYRAIQQGWLSPAANGLSGQNGQGLAGMPASAPAVAKTQSPTTQDSAELARIRLELEMEKSARRQLDGKLAESDSAVKRLSGVEESLAAKDKKLQETAKALSDLQDDKARLLAVVKDLSDAQAKLDASEKRLAAAIEELQRARKSNGDLQAAKDKIDEDLFAVKARRDMLLADVQRSYLADDYSFKARQDVAKRNRLLERCGEIRKAGSRGTAANLMDRLEVVFLRLSMLDTADKAADASFARLLRETDLLRQIDEELATGMAGEKIRAWLLEARCVLMGADRAA